MKKFIKPALIVIGVLLVLIQFFRPERNLSGDKTNDIAKAYPVPEGVQNILKTSCYDCHSNTTVYPWYAEIQPVAWWLADHIAEGKREVNFDAFTARKVAVQNKKFKEIIGQVKKDEMPLSSYTLIHRNAILTAEQKEQLISWAQAMQDTLKSRYPADSLVLKRRPD